MLRITQRDAISLCSLQAGADIISIHAEPSSTIHLDRIVNQVCLWVLGQLPGGWLGCG